MLQLQGSDSITDEREPMMIALGQVRLSRLVTANVGNTEAALSPMEGQAAEAPFLKCLVQLGRIQIHQIVLERFFKNFFFLAHLTHLNDYRRPLSWSRTSTHYLYHRRLWNLPWSLQAIRGVVTVWLCQVSCLAAFFAPMVSAIAQLSVQHLGENMQP